MDCPNCGSERVRQRTGSYGMTLVECLDCQHADEIPNPNRKPKLNLLVKQKKSRKICVGEFIA